jgi:glycosyltransferase involved in cell wall biosynthesis
MNKGINHKKQNRFENRPMFSIVTITFNAENYVEETIKSVISQTYKNFEYIVIDGNSKDSTIEIINKYRDQIDSFISEADNGIYDAMNKAIEISTGRFINFMNAGDIFYSKNVLKNVVNSEVMDYDILYGSTEVRFLKDKKLYGKISNALKLDDLWKGLISSHQSMFTKTEIIKRIKFKEIGCGADFEFLFNCFSLGFRFKRINHIIASYLLGGYSFNRRSKATMSHYRTIKNYKKLNLKNHAYYIKKIVSAILYDLFIYLFPSIGYSIIKVHGKYYKINQN